LGGGFPFPIVLVPRYKLSLCHTPIKPDLPGFPRIGIFVCRLRDHEVHIIWYQSLAPLIKLYPSEIFVSCWFRKNSLVFNFFFSLNLRHIKKIIISFCYCSKYISSMKKREKQISQKNVYWFLLQKTKQRNIRSKQLAISSKLILRLLGSSSLHILIWDSIAYRLLWFSISGLIRSDS